MSTSTNHKRIDVHQNLQQASRQLRALGDPLIHAGDALKALGQALKRLKYASERAKPTIHQWEDEKGQHIKVSRDGLPQRIRTRAARLATMVDALAMEVKGLPVTREQKALAKVAREKRREKGAKRP